VNSYSIMLHELKNEAHCAKKREDLNGRRKDGDINGACVWVWLG